MFLQKIVIGLALGSVVGSGFSQTINVGSFSTTNKISLISNAQAKANFVFPFNPLSIVHGYQADGNVYAYYKNNAFPVKTPNTISNGYAFKLTTKSLQDMMKAYDWAGAHSVGQKGAMISYITGCLDFDTPYAHEFALSSKYEQDAQRMERITPAWSFNKSKLPLYKFIKSAVTNNQNLFFYFYSKIQGEGLNTTFYGKVEMYNDISKSTLTTDYDKSIIHI